MRWLQGSDGEGASQTVGRTDNGLRLQRGICRCFGFSNSPPKPTSDPECLAGVNHEGGTNDEGYDDGQRPAGQR